MVASHKILILLKVKVSRLTEIPKSFSEKANFSFIVIKEESSDVGHKNETLELRLFISGESNSTVVILTDYLSCLVYFGRYIKIDQLSFFEMEIILVIQTPLHFQPILKSHIVENLIYQL
jgi:hypothetical protein